MRWSTLLVVAGCIEYEPAGDLAPVGAPQGEVPAAADVPEGSNLDGFDLAQTSSVDVIVFGDTSGSMDAELRTMGETITPFVERLAQTTSDWQLASVNGDEGCAVTGILTPDTRDFADIFADAIVESPWDDDSNESGLLAVTRAIENSRDGDCNDGLVRGGFLQLVFVSDENDESPGYDESVDYWKEYWDRIVAVHGNASMITASAVNGPTPHGCSGADPGFGYDKVIEGTGGAQLSICDDWASQIDVIADASADQDTFVLSDVPVPSTIQVWVNGAGVPAAGRWHYAAGPNAVVFDRDPPGPGDTVDILYDVAE